MTSEINPTIASTVRENSENKRHEEAIENQAPEFRHADKELGDAVDERFFLDENEDVIDRLNPVRGMSYCYYGDANPNQFRLRESILRRRLDKLVGDLIPNRQPEVTDSWGHTYQPFNHEQFAVSNALFEAIRASHLRGSRTSGVYEPTSPLHSRLALRSPVSYGFALRVV